MLHQKIVYGMHTMKPSPCKIEMRLMEPRRDGVKLKMKFLGRETKASFQVHTEDGPEP